MSLNRRYIAALILAGLPIVMIVLMSLWAMETRAAETVFTYDDLGRLATVTNFSLWSEYLQGVHYHSRSV